MYNFPNTKIQTFGLAFCQLVDLPKTLIDCSTNDPQKCVQCSVEGTYFSGESIHDYTSYALLLYYFLWMLILLVSLFGICGNILIINVLRKRKSEGSFDLLLLFLASWDIFSGVMSMLASTGSTAYFGNWFGRGKGTIYFYSLTLYTVIFSRSGSIFMTVLITIERFLIIRFPLRANTWFTLRNTKILACVVLVIAVLLSFPRYVSLCVEPNTMKDVPSLSSLDYVMRRTTHGAFWYRTMKAIHNQIDFWLPFPIILLFNLLSCRKVYQLSKRRKEMNLNEKQNIRAARMFLPVVIVYFLTNIEPIVNYMIIHFMKTAYRELLMLLYLSIAVNSAVIMPIYYYCNTAFRSEARLVLYELTGWNYFEDNENNTRCGSLPYQMSTVASDNRISVDPRSGYFLPN